MSQDTRYRWLRGLAVWIGLLAPGCQHPPAYVGTTVPLATSVDLDLPSALGAPSTSERMQQPPRPTQEEGGPKKGRPALQIPPELPGAGTPALRLPPLGPKTEAQRDRAIRELYPKLTPVGVETQPAPGPGGRPLTLADLQNIASANSPVLRRAAADVEGARGVAVQAGLPPNPTAGYETDQLQTFGPSTPNAGQQGLFLSQLIKTGGKLQLAQAAAQMDLINAQINLREAQVDVTAKVRAGYFAVLVAQENVLISRALVELTDEAYRLHTQLVRGNEVAPYEPLQIYVQAEQARANLIQARNRYVSAWKQLAAALGKAEMPPTALTGRADAAVPLYRYDEALDRILASHTDVRQAENVIQKARYNLKLAETNRRPDISTYGTVEYDDAARNMQLSMQIGFAGLPVWDQNQGNILQAKSQLARAVHDLEATRNDLVAKLADAFERYENNRVLVVNYREKILTNQVRAYRAIRDRYQLEPDKVGFVDVVQAQQMLASVLTTYLGFLGAEWTAVVDVATLLQTNDLYAPAQPPCEPAVGPPLPELLRGAAWPPAAPEERRGATLLPPAEDIGPPRALPPAPEPGPVLEAPKS